MRKDVLESMQAASLEANVVKAAFRMDASLAVFRGHFPGRPLVPGVLEIEMVRTAVSAATGRRLRIAGIPKAKFARQVEPGQTVDVLAKLTDGPAELTADAHLHVTGAMVAAISLILADDAAHPG